MQPYGIQVYRAFGHNCVCTYLNCAFSVFTFGDGGWKRTLLYTWLWGGGENSKLLFLTTAGIYQAPIRVKNEN